MENNRSETTNTPFKTLVLDVDYYQPFLDDETIPDELKREFLETLWAMMVQFVDLGFGIEGTQRVLQTRDRSPPTEATKQIDQALLGSFKQSSAKSSKETPKEEEIYEF
ncbi:MAG: hypothetical protein AAF234_13760 [Pseudomonadota bacterium]